MIGHHHIGHQILPHNNYVHLEVAGEAFAASNKPLHHSTLPYPPMNVVDSKAVELGKSLWADIKESDHRLRAVTSLLGVTAVAGVGLPKLPALLAYSAAAKLQKETGIPGVWDVAAGAALAGWGGVAARIYNSAIDNHPRTFASAAHNPAMTSVGEAASVLLPGLEPVPKQKLGTRLVRGALVNMSFMSLYVAAAGQRKQSPEDRKRLCRNLGIDGGIFIGFTALAFTGFSAALKPLDPELAGTILDAKDNPKVLLAGLLGLSALGVARKKLLNPERKRRRKTPASSLQLVPEGE
jgi:hypothetical protein